MHPLVSVICLCYNHEKYLTEALDSVLTQTYPNLEIIVIDDASTDNSPNILKEYKAKRPKIKLILHQTNTGNCKAFNEGFQQSSGEYIIDFATDDILLPTRISEQVQAFATLDKSFGVIFTDAELISENGKHLRYFYPRNEHGELLVQPPSGNVFASVLQKSFLCPPTLIFRRAVLDKLNGYDESLAYEDFDFWVRSSREFKYFFLDKVLTKRRVHQQSLSQQAYKTGDKQLESTIKVCRKALKLIRTSAEKLALIIRVRSELRQAFSTQNFTESQALLLILKELNGGNWKYRLIDILTQHKVNLSFVRKFYYKLKYKQ